MTTRQIAQAMLSTAAVALLHGVRSRAAVSQTVLVSVREQVGNRAVNELSEKHDRAPSQCTPAKLSASPDGEGQG